MQSCFAQSHVLRTLGSIDLVSSAHGRRCSVGHLLGGENGQIELSLAIIPISDGFLEFDIPPGIESDETHRPIKAIIPGAAPNINFEIGEVTFVDHRARAKFFGITDFHARFYF